MPSISLTLLRPKNFSSLVAILEKKIEFPPFSLADPLSHSSERRAVLF